MADAGLTVYGDSGILQIDNTYRNLVLREKGTITTDTYLFNGGTGNQVSYKTIGLRSGFTSPVLAVGGGTLAQPEQSWSGGQVAFIISASGPIGTTVPYWIYDVPSGPSPDNCGMQVWSSAGQLIYDTGWAPMRVAGFLTNMNAGTLFTGTSGKTYALAHVVRGYRAVTVEALNIRAMMSSVSGATITGANVPVAVIPSSPTQTNVKQLTAIVLDVTNH